MKLPTGLALTGRIQSYLENPAGRLPVSCTCYLVESSDVGIADSLRFTSYALRHGAGVALHLHNLDVTHLFGNKFFFGLYIDPSHPNYSDFVDLPWVVRDDWPEDTQWIKVADTMDNPKEGVTIEESWRILLLNKTTPIVFDLSNLRPEGVDNGKGLVASGPVSFAQILIEIYRLNMFDSNKYKFYQLMTVYSKLNEVLRRGGLYKNGAIVLHLDADHPQARDFVLSPREVAPWARLCLNVNQVPTKKEREVIDAALLPLSAGDLFMVKKVFHNNERLYHNVCLEVLLPHRGTCLLAHVNLGKLEPQQIPTAFVESMEWLCSFHKNTNVAKDKMYLPPSKDRQVGLGVIGLANFLGQNNVTYRQFVDDLKAVLDGSQEQTLAYFIYQGYQKAAEVARKYKMDRAFAIAPTANTSYNYVDKAGYVTTPEISPPVNRQVIRVSETTEERTVEYPPYVEIAIEVGWDTYFELVDCWMKMMQSTGLAHSISSNWWSDQVVCNMPFVDRWLQSSWLSLYYALPVSPTDQDKTELPFCDITCSSCAE